MTTEELVYDPNTKQMIKDKIYHYLYDPLRESFQKRLDALIMQNSLLHKNDHRWMLFKGVEYHTKESGPRPRQINMCHPDIKPVMKDYVRDMSDLNNKEIPYVLGFINQVLNTSNSLQDYFKVFPESVHKPIRDLVNECGCRTEHLQPEKVERLKERHSNSIEMMKKRMVLNLLL